MRLFQTIYDLLLSPLLLGAVLSAGLYCTLRLGGYFCRSPLRPVRDLLSPKTKGGRRSALRALSVALAGTLGVGNIAGVASAIAAGGAGAVFWMWVGALLSMLIKYAEVVLAIRYRRPVKDGFLGGAMYYMKRPAVAALFALFCLFASFTLGNTLQARTVAESVEGSFGVSPWVSGLLLALVLYLAICRGFSRISAVTLWLVPMMSGLYVVLCLFCILRQADALPGALSQIFHTAFAPKAALGGVGGLTLARAVRAGISRGLITHEAGCGTAPMAHAEADTDSPVRQGFLGIFEVFADTCLLCSLTALVLIPFADRFAGADGMSLVIAAFGQSIGQAAGPVLTLLILCFALATMLGWSHYGMNALAYLTRSCRRPETIKKLYAVAYSLVAIGGALLSADAMWLLSDYAVALMTLLHLPDLLFKTGEVAGLTRIYFAGQAYSARSLENTLAPDALRAKSKDLRDTP